jgi:type I restriction enzyme S subunit
LPEGWCWATVEQVSYIVRYGTSAKTSNNNAGVPVLRMGNIQDSALDFSNLKYLPIDHPEFPTLLLKAGDLLFNRTNSAELVGKSAIYRGEFPLCSYASYLISVRLLIDYLADYLCFYINSYYGKVWIKSVYTQQAGQANVNGSKLQALVFPLPPLAEQEQIVAEVEARLSNIEHLEKATEDNLKRAERERQSILQEAFAGRLVPQDPNDEPAGILLERIREERKKREEEEKIVKISRKGNQMGAAKKRQIRKITVGQAGVGLYEVLVAEGEPLQPQEVFRKVGLKTEDQPESVETFYEELRSDVADGLIGVIRPDTTTVLLEALDVPVEEEEIEALEHVEEEIEEAVELVQEEEEIEEVVELVQKENKEDEKSSLEWPTLWDELDKA